MNKKTLAIVLSFSGTALSVWIAVFKQAHPSVDLQDLIAIAGPWFLLDVILLSVPWYRGVSLAAATMLALELFIFWGVFINPKSSTDAVAYVFKPFVQVLVLLPICLAIGRALDKREPGRTAR